MAFAWPRLRKPPLVFDQASAVMARGDIMIAEQKQQQLPHGVGVDKNGNPSQTPSDILQGAQLAFGGYKGANIAMMIELLAGPLIGETTSLETAKSAPSDGSPPAGGEFILAVNPALFGDRNTADAYAENMFAAILENPDAKLPGDRRYKNREHSEKNGFSLSKELHDKILKIAEIS
jgi:delta1-piperideine-2-carboxylate reductase